MNHDRLFGLAYVCDRRHSGQWSRGYRILSRLHGPHWRMRRPTTDACNLLPRDEWREARDWAAHYTRLVRNREISL